jgi:hypothetical protein
MTQPVSRLHAVDIRLLWDPKAHYRVHMRPTTWPCPQIKSFKYQDHNIHFSIIILYPPSGGAGIAQSV